MNPRISVLVLTYNGAATLPAVLDAIARQRLDSEVEIVAVDSGSRDGTLELLHARATHVIQIPPSEFNHGATRNLGVARCRGDVVVLLVQDALPADDQWLATLTAPLFEDPTVAATFARQQPLPQASPLTRHYFDGWLAAKPDPWVSAVSDREAFLRLPPMEQYVRCVFDNVCSCIRRTVWAEHSFPVTAIAEDLEWARTVLLAGYRIRYVPEAVVLHSHERSARYELYRTYLVHERLRAMFGVQLIPTSWALLRAIATIVPTHVRCAFHDRTVPRRKALARALSLAVAFPLGQYLGARSADTGRALLRPKGV